MGKERRLQCIKNIRKTMTKAPAFQFYVQDFLLGTADFSAEEVGGYIRLLSHQWDKGGLPNDDKRLLKMTGMKAKSLPVVKSKFTIDEDGQLRNHRLEMERVKQVEWRMKSAEAGKKSGHVRRIQSATKNEPTFENGSNQSPTNLQPTYEPNANQKRTLQSSSSSSDIVITQAMLGQFKTTSPSYPVDAEKDLPACLSIAYRIGKMKNWTKTDVTECKKNDVLALWVKMLEFIHQDKWISTRSIADLDKEWQRLVMSYKQWVNEQNTVKV
jgi:uncharacterized protein YdaU (DUF1376 family)